MSFLFLSVAFNVPYFSFLSLEVGSLRVWLSAVSCPSGLVVEETHSKSYFVRFSLKM